MTSLSASNPLISRLRAALLLAALGAVLGACKHTDGDVTASIDTPTDYRQRHPIVVQEADKSIEVFVGTGRGGLTAAQRTDVSAFAHTWQQEGTGPIAIDMPVSTSNARAAAQTVQDIQQIMVSVGIPGRGVTVRRYTPADQRVFATVKLSYPRVRADAGPCGEWPEELGPTLRNKTYQENRPYSNFGCATQRNMAAMVANPADLVQPRPESPANTTRRTTVLGKYTRGESTAAQNPDADKNKISDVGK